MGIHRQSHGEELWQTKPHISGDGGASGQGVFAQYAASDLYRYFDALATRLRRVRVCCGEWHRILSPSCTTKIGLTSVFLDPPYDLRQAQDTVSPTDNLYSEHDHDLSVKVREWAIAHGDDPLMRIALCGYDTEHADMPSSWTEVSWKPNGGYANQSNGKGRANKSRERIWFSPYCLPVGLFEQEASV